MLDVVSKKSKIGKVLDDLEWSNEKVAARLDVASQTVSKWRNLKQDGTTHHKISYENLSELIYMIKDEAHMVIDPSDLIENPEFHNNTLKVIGSLDSKTSNINLYARHKNINVDTKYPPDVSSVEWIYNEDKTYYYIFDSMEYNPNLKIIQNCDVIFHFKKGKYMVGLDVQIGFDNQLKFTNRGVLRFAKNPSEIIKTSDLKCFHIITDIKIKNKR